MCFVVLRLFLIFYLLIFAYELIIDLFQKGMEEPIFKQLLKSILNADILKEKFVSTDKEFPSPWCYFGRFADPFPSDSQCRMLAPVDQKHKSPEDYL